MRACLLFLTFLFGAELASADTKLVMGDLQDEVALDVTFSGHELLVFGAVESDTDVPLDIIVLLTGPSEDVKVTKKSKIFGVWLTSEVYDVKAIPSYLGVYASRPLAQILTDDMRQERGIGVRERLLQKEPIDLSRPFIEGLVRNKARSETYVTNEKGVDVKSNLLFSTRAPLSANIAAGEYSIEVLLVQDKEIVAQQEFTIFVNAIGVDGWLYSLSQQYSFLYGLLAVFLAVSISFIVRTAITFLLTR